MIAHENPRMNKPPGLFASFIQHLSEADLSEAHLSDTNLS